MPALKRFLRWSVVAVATFVLPTGVQAEIIDRILAVVSGEVITLSDAVAAQRFGLVEPAQGVDPPVRAVVDALIDRQLQLAEVNRFLPPEPSEAAIQEGMRAVRARFPTAEALDAALEETGRTIDQLTRAIRDNLRIERYHQQRFGAVMQPTEEDVLRYYREHQDSFVSGGRLQPYDQVRDEARARLAAERTSALVREWVEGLRRRAEVTVLPPR
ncbi:MAG TPA: hypothetical protein VLD67_03885 [Vicinamibacterales bacterium]|nr:hypothetical protein [Vicinamibacterales bacterium]